MKVAVNYEILQDHLNSNAIYTSPTKTPSFEVLEVFIDAAHALGLRVLLKPMVVCKVDDCTFFEIIPSEPAAWFESYTQYMLQLAAFCAGKRVDALSVGLEFYHISGASYTSYWTVKLSPPPPKQSIISPI